MATGNCSRVIRIILVMILVLLLVIEFLSLFIGLAFLIIPSPRKNLVHHGLFMILVAALVICLGFIGLCGAIRECYLKLFVYRCCGLDGPQTWIHLNLSIPYSCCHHRDSSFDPIVEYCINSGNGDHMYMRGCAGLMKPSLESGRKYDADVFKDKTKDKFVLATTIRVVGYVVQVAVIIVACWLAFAIRKELKEEAEKKKIENRKSFIMRNPT